MKVYIYPTPDNAPNSNGIGRIVHAQFKHLPRLGVTIVKDPRKADVIACHVAQGEMPRIDVMHSHGLYFEDLPHAQYVGWNYAANKAIADSARVAKVITVPSKWVALPFQRDMHISPLVIPHAIDLNEWRRDENKGYILWNKGRGDDVCDPTPAWELANRGLPVISTFSPQRQTPETMHLVGPQPFEQMRKLVQCADIYLATTPETFGIGTIEAMACGIPVLGYDWAGTADIVQHRVNGYLVAPGDLEALAQGYHWLKENYTPLSENARARAEQFTWEKIMPLYVQAYQQALATPKERGVSVVIPCYDYGRYLGECLDSVIKSKPDEIIVVDDGSSDDTAEVVKPYLSNVRYLWQPNQGVAAARNHGIQASNFDFITCLDADDRIHPDFVPTLRKALESDPGLGVAYSGLAMIDANGVANPYHAWPNEFSWKVQSQGGVPPGNSIPSGCMFRKKMWARAGGYKQEFAPGEDAEFWTRGLSLGFTAKRVTTAGLFEYRGHEGSASRSKKYHEIDTWLPWVKSKEYPFAAPQESARVWARMLPVVSVIIPVGPGHEYYLADAVRSVEGQTMREWQLIVIDDTEGGIPKDVLAVMPFAEMVKGRRAGAGAARNDGLPLVKGQFVVFLDADDYLEPQALEKMLKHYDGKGYVYTDWWAIKSNGGAEMHLKPFDHESLKLQHAVTTLLPTVWAKQLKFDETLPAWEDVDYYLQARGKGFCGIHLPEPLLYYRLETGKRRVEAERRDKELNAELVKRHKGVVKMACGSCPSPAAGPIMQAKRMMAAANGQAMAPDEIVATDNGLVELEFSGTQTGSRTFNGQGGRTYKAGNNSVNRYINVDPVDVEKLMATGMFRIVQKQYKAISTPMTATAPAPKAAAPVESAPVKAEVKVAESTPAPVESSEPLPENIKDLRSAVRKASHETLVSWEYQERVGNQRKVYLEILRAALKKAELEA